MRWVDAVRQRSFAHLYMAEPPPPGTQLPPHPLWQAPFMLAAAEAPWAEVMARARLAGQLWLMNYDLRPFNELIIAHASEPWFTGFQRGERPDEDQVLIGPYARRVLDPATATPLFGPLVYREAEQSSGREMWRQLATPTSER